MSVCLWCVFYFWEKTLQVVSVVGQELGTDVPGNVLIVAIDLSFWWCLALCLCRIHLQKCHLVFVPAAISWIPQKEDFYLFVSQLSADVLESF